MAAVSTQSSLDAKILSICDIMRRSNAASALQYIPELTWILFLRILDDRETLEAEEARIVGSSFSPSLEFPYRWQDWASPTGKKRRELQNSMAGDIFRFVNDDPTHIFTLSQAYEGLLLRMGEKNNDGGQFFTPREVIRAMVRVIDPKVGETVFDPGCGTGGFLAQAYDYMKANLGQSATADAMSVLATKTFYGREKENLIYPIALANLVLHGIDQPNIWHGNTLTRNETYGGLFQGAPELFDTVLMNPPFGGREGQDARTRYPYKTGATQVLFLQEVIDSLKNEGRAGIVVDEGLLFRTNETAFVQTKRKLLDECNLYCIVSLPGGVFTQAGAGVKTNLLFFNKGGYTEKVWYYDLSHLKVAKRKPLTASHFEEFFRLLPTRGESENSWTVTRAEIEEKNYDLKAVNPNRVEEVDTRTPKELLDIIEQKGKEIRGALETLRKL